jgi:predicted nuclease of restriction endonuclease-like (RecB) superfamily
MSFLVEIKTQISNSQYRAVTKVNQELLFLYWNIGKLIIQLQEKTAWGDNFLEQLARDIKKEFPTTQGYSYRNLKYMRAFARQEQEFVFGQTPSAQITWSHNTLLLDKCKDTLQRLWYAQKSIEFGWSVRILEHQIDTQLYERSGKAISNFTATLPNPQSELAQSILKDPYNFDFLQLSKEILEKDLEQALIIHITKFLLELGTGFAFVGKQYAITIDDKDYKIDLLFYHLKLRCYVVIELKITDFQPEYVGKLNFYINAINGEVKNEWDNPTIGILLCKNKGGKTTVEYALSNINTPIGVAAYTLFDQMKANLPPIELLERELKNVRLSSPKRKKPKIFSSTD